jgi:hypothetical protein
MYDGFTYLDPANAQSQRRWGYNYGYWKVALRFKFCSQSDLITPLIQIWRFKIFLMWPIKYICIFTFYCLFF